MDVRKIWDQAPHNALTDLIRFRSGWLCVFREGADHVSPDGKIRILASQNGLEWQSAALLEIPGLDLRDPKICLTPEGKLMLNAGAAHRTEGAVTHRSFVWFSRDGIEWGAPCRIGDPDYWIWRITWCRGIAYGIGYRTIEPNGIRIYSSRDGSSYTLLADSLFTEGSPNEATLVFQPDQTALCLLRRDGDPATAILGDSQPPYAVWSWKDLGLRIGGPNLLQLADGRIVAAVRRYGKIPWTSLNWLDQTAGKLEEFLALPSGGDTSYAGLDWHEGILRVSYYSSHEQHTSIYLARIRLPLL